MAGASEIEKKDGGGGRRHGMTAMKMCKASGQGSGRGGCRDFGGPAKVGDHIYAVVSVDGTL